MKVKDGEILVNTSWIGNPNIDFRLYIFLLCHLDHVLTPVQDGLIDFATIDDLVEELDSLGYAPEDTWDAIEKMVEEGLAKIIPGEPGTGEDDTVFIINSAEWDGVIRGKVEEEEE